MKFNSLFFPTLFTAIFTCCCVFNTHAQAPVVPGGDYCDDLIPKIKKELRDDANAECRTMYLCFECIERKSNEEIYVTVVVQPTDAKCKPAPEILKTEASASRGDKPAKPGFRVEILQSPCFAGGTNLQVYIPGYGPDSREFSYLWEIDGKKAGHLPSVQCACGTKATVRVTHLPTGNQLIKGVRLHPCGTPIPSNDK